MDYQLMDIVHNAALLCTLALLYDTLPLITRSNQHLYAALKGTLVGAIGVMLLLTPWTIVPGVNIDTRSVLISMSGLFIGIIPTVIASAMMVAFRIFQGGSGELTGAAIIVTSAAIGLVWSRYRPGKEHAPTGPELLLFGIVVHLCLLAWMLSLPGGLAFPVLKAITLPTTLLNPLLTVILGLYLGHRKKSKEVERHLQQTEAKLKAFFDHSTSAMAVWRVAGSIECLTMNEKMAAIVGRLIATKKALSDEFPGNEDQAKKIHDDAVRLIIKTKKASSEIVSITGKTGEISHFIANYFPITTRATDQIDTVGGIFIDITEKVNAENHLVASEQQYRSLITRISSGFALCESIHDQAGKPIDYRFLLVNKAFEELTELQPDGITGKTILELMPDLEKRWVEQCAKVVLTGESTHFEHYAAHLGKFFDVVAYAPAANQVALIITDISVRKETEKEKELVQQSLESTIRERTKELEQRVDDSEKLNRAMVNLLDDLQQSHRQLEIFSKDLTESNRELEEFSYTVAHDLRAPLRWVEGFSKALLDDYVDRLDDRGKHYLERVRSAAMRMSQLIDDLLWLARVSRVQLQSEPVDLSTIFREIVDAYNETLIDQKVTVSIQPGLQAFCDPDLIKVVLENLIGNAFKFTRNKKNPMLAFDCETVDKETIFRIKDNGVGFDMHYVNKLFNPFQRLHSEEEFEGTGIGLSIVDKILKRHQGRVWSESTEGQGATFYFTIPEQKQEVKVKPVRLLL